MAGKEEKKSGWDLFPREGTQRKKEYRATVQPWEVNSLSHISSVPALGLDTRKTRPLAGWTAAKTNRRAVRSLDSTGQTCVHMACSQDRV